MLFSKQIEPRCAYCKRGARLDDDRVMCLKKGIVSAGGQCRRECAASAEYSRKGGFTPPEEDGSGLPQGRAALWDVGDVAQQQLGAHGDDLNGM